MSLANQVIIVLVESSDPGNIGACARAMKTMGLSSLRLVNPTFFPHPKALWRAAHASDILDGATIYTSLQQAIADCQLVFATSARNRALPWPQTNAAQAGELVNSAIMGGNRVALVFGREKSGLDNDELQQCSYHIHIQANPDYAVLNLSHALQIIAYEVYKQHTVTTSSTQPVLSNHLPAHWDNKRATHKEISRMIAELEKMLVRIDFYNPDNPQQLMPRLRRFFNRTAMDVMEVNIWRGIISRIISYSKYIRDKKIR